MKSLIINGSPRKNGNTSYIINKLCKSLNGTVDIINSFDIEYSPCIDCKKCINDNSCIYNDKITNLIEHIDDYDLVILSSPLYYNQPTGSLLMLISRFQLLFNTKKNLKEKLGGIILVGGGDTIVNSADAEKTMRIILRGLNINKFAYIRSLHTSSIPACQDKSIDIQIQEFINIINIEQA